MIYNEFKSVIQQQVVAEPLLPIRQLDEDSSSDSGFGADYLFEPAPEVLFEDLLPGTWKSRCSGRSWSRRPPRKAPG